MKKYDKIKPYQKEIQKKLKKFDKQHLFKYEDKCLLKINRQLLKHCKYFNNYFQLIVIF